MRKTVSLVMLWSMIVMTFTGIMLFIAPQGKIAYWVDWTMFGLSKTDLGNLHTTFMVLFVVATIFHVYYNWKPMVSYMSNKAKEFVFITKENLIALGITIVFIFGTMGKSGDSILIFFTLRSPSLFR
ncbi:MAG: DUF4405 domain-containing protein [Campylobacterales bacterium]|nr:DUF4405 domain-containing protein [Campylobacterales bacterium]